MGRCKFRDVWLQKKDKNGHLISTWASKHSETEVFCKFCVTTVDFHNKGLHALFQHSCYIKHKTLASNALGPLQMVLAKVPGNVSDSCQKASETATTSNVIQLYCHKNQDIISELIWVLKSVNSNYSASSCISLKDTFEAMFPSIVPSNFCLNPRKMRYLISDALGPYFHQMLSEDVGASYYSICFDETTNVKDKKELQITIRYWSETKGSVVSRHLQSFFIGKATAEILHDKISSSISNANLTLYKLLMIGSDGPNVNKKVHRLFNDEVIELRSQGLVDVGTCPLHIVHNAYLKSLQIFGEDASELVIAIFHYFDGWPARLEEYQNVQEKLKLPQRKFLKHSTCRWLTFNSAAERLLEQWDGVIHYFFKFIPSNKCQSIMQSSSYKRISNLLQCSDMKAQLYFTMSSSNLFSNFTHNFQNDAPLIHILYLKLEELIGKLSRRVCKSTDVDELFDSKNILPLKKIVVSQQVKKELEKLSEPEAARFMNNVKEHYIGGCKYLIEKVSKNYSFLKALKCLNPSLIKKRQSCQDIILVARELPIDVQEDILIDEWKILQMEEELSFEGRVDTYWNQILQKTNTTGQKKYSELAKVVKVALSLSHGNADIERRFSISRWALTEDKSSTCERTFNSILMIKDSLKAYGDKPHLVPITSKLIAMARSANQSYKTYLEEQRKLKEMEEKKTEETMRLTKESEENIKQAEESKKKICELENEILHTKKSHETASIAYNNLFNEAYERLKKAIQKGDMEEINVAQGMLDGVKSLREQEQQKLKEVEILRKTVNKRKNNLLTTFLSKKPKNS